VSRKEEELTDIRDVEGVIDKRGNSCLKVGGFYTLHSNTNGTVIISKKIPSFRYLRIRSCKNKEEAQKLFDALEGEKKEQMMQRCAEKEAELKPEEKDRLMVIREKMMRDENLTVEEFEFLEMG
jgi:guanylate kinase